MSCEWFNYTITTNSTSWTYCTVPPSCTQASWYIDTICRYSEVRRYVLIDQKGYSDGVQACNVDNLATGRNNSCYDISINSNYVDGVSISYNSSNQHQHLYMHTVGRDHSPLPQSCQCHGTYNLFSYPYFLMWDFMCDSGYSSVNSSTVLNFAPRTLFTGEGCYDGGCYQVIGAPWFYCSLPVQVTDSRLEVRILSDGGHQDEMILLREAEFYVR